MAKAKIELVGPLSLSVGRYRFQKGRPVLTDDAELIRYCQFNPDFKCSILGDEGQAKKPVPRSQVREQAKAKAEEKKAEPEAAKPEVKKSKPEPVSDEVEEDDVALGSSDESEEPQEPESSSRLTRKKKRSKGDGA